MDCVMDWVIAGTSAAIIAWTKLCMSIVSVLGMEGYVMDELAKFGRPPDRIH